METADSRPGVHPSSRDEPGLIPTIPHSLAPDGADSNERVPDGGVSPESLLPEQDPSLSKITPVTRDRKRFRRRWFRGTWLKHALVCSYYWGSRFLPSPLVRGGFLALTGGAKLLSRIPGNPVRRSCDDLAELARARGIERNGGQIYRDFIEQFEVVGPLLHNAYRHGPEPVLEVCDLAPEDRALVDKLRREHGGVLIPIPHNVGAAVSGVAFSHAFPSLLMGKNGDAAWRAAIAVEVFERMGIQPLLVRGKNPMTVSRRVFEALNRDQVVVATVDNLHRKSNRVDAEIFGGAVGFNPWAVRLAARAKVPVLPGYVGMESGRLKFVFGDPILGAGVQETVQHFTQFFEDRILLDPASWAFMAHKRWRMVLSQAAERVRKGDTSGRPFEIRSRKLQRREGPPLPTPNRVDAPAVPARSMPARRPGSR